MVLNCLIGFLVVNSSTMHYFVSISFISFLRTLVASMDFDLINVATLLRDSDVVNRMLKDYLMMIYWL